MILAAGKWRKKKETEPKLKANELESVLKKCTLKQLKQLSRHFGIYPSSYDEAYFYKKSMLKHFINNMNKVTDNIKNIQGVIDDCKKYKYMVLCSGRSGKQSYHVFYTNQVNDFPSSTQYCDECGGKSKCYINEFHK